MGGTALSWPRDRLASSRNALGDVQGPGPSQVMAQHPLAGKPPGPRFLGLTPLATQGWAGDLGHPSSSFSPWGPTLAQWLTNPLGQLKFPRGGSDGHGHLGGKAGLVGVAGRLACPGPGSRAGQSGPVAAAGSAGHGAHIWRPGGHPPPSSSVSLQCSPFIATSKRPTVASDEGK